MASKIEIGSVVNLEIDTRPMRVLMMDDHSAFYDSFWPDLGRWVFDGAKTLSYYRIDLAWLEENARFLRSEPLSEIERTRHRPDLPLRFLQSDRIQWSEEVFPTLEAFRGACGAELDGAASLPISEVALSGEGPQGGVKKPIRYRAMNDQYFTAFELLWRAHQTQRPNVRGPQTRGVGIYRLGLSNGVPSYHLSGSTLA